jgi:peptidoglycan/LPS O-acetylase OafA/YrhL
MILTAFLLIAVLAELNFRLLENPLRQFGIELSAKRLKRLRGINANQPGEQTFVSARDTP